MSNSRIEILFFVKQLAPSIQSLAQPLTRHVASHTVSFSFLSFISSRSIGSGCPISCSQRLVYQISNQWNTCRKFRREGKPSYYCQPSELNRWPPGLRTSAFHRFRTKSVQNCTTAYMQYWWAVPTNFCFWAGHHQVQRALVQLCQHRIHSEHPIHFPDPHCTWTSRNIITIS